MTSPRWWEPRFEGAITRSLLPSSVFERLVERANETGLRVLEPPPAEPLPSYRASAAPLRSLHLEQREAFVGAWDRLHVWQEGAGAIRFEGSFQRWANHLRIVWAAFAVLYGGMLTFCCPTTLALAVGVVLVLTFLPFQWVHRGRTTRWVERFVEDQVKLAEGLLRVPPPIVATTTAAAVRIEPVVRVRAGDPVLVATARTMHDAVTRHADRSPEDEVLALEEAAKRR
ncbi:MAG TPA: hypothetical protein VGG39_33010 [Polyangiaceae bacterium]